MKKAVLKLSAIGLGVCGSMQVVEAEQKVSLFPLQDVRLLDGPFKSAMEVDRRYILSHSVDRLLAPFRREAGLPKLAESYGNWESMGLDGHTAGHYLSALAMMYASTGDTEIKNRMDYMVSQLAECQKAFGNGYVGGVPRSKSLWDDVAAGRLKVNGFGLNDRWVPWYNIHKTYAGMRDAYFIGKNEQAKTVLIGMADWCLELISHLSDVQLQNMLRAEHGGMTESLADVYAITGDKKYLDAANRFSDHQILDPLVASRDEMTGKHANTQIPKVIGFERIAALTGNTDMHRAAHFFWDNVTGKRSVSIGGNSVNEHFNPTNDFKTMIEDRTGPETCNTYNMLRLTEALFQANPAGNYADFYERALFNHILSTQDPQHGGFVYFTPMRPQHYRVYSTAEKGFWCCVGTGFENHAKYGSFIYAHDASSLYVNLFLASELHWNQQGLTLRQETKFPDETRSRLILTLKETKKLKLHLRKPTWLAGDKYAMRVNGDSIDTSTTADGYVVMDRQWKDGDVIEVDLPMKVTTERLPDNSGYVSLLYGPIVLAAPTGTENLKGLFAEAGRGDHISGGELMPMIDAPTIVTDDSAKIIDQLKKSSDRLEYSFSGMVQPDRYKNIKLIPFFRLHESRYSIYFPTYSSEQYAKSRQHIEDQERELLALEKATFDRVIPGAQQSEVEHDFKGELTTNGTHLDRGWRDARGWFSYNLNIPADQESDLLLQFFGGDTNRRFSVLADDTSVAEISLDGAAGNTFIYKRYQLPKDLAGKKITLRFNAAANSIAGGVFDIRIIRRDLAGLKNQVK